MHWISIMRKFVITTLIFLTFGVTSVAAETGIAGIDHFGLAVTDLQASKKFFLEVLGFDHLGEDRVCIAVLIRCSRSQDMPTSSALPVGICAAN